jgi:hypothetical protein
LLIGRVSLEVNETFGKNNIHQGNSMSATGTTADRPVSSGSRSAWNRYRSVLTASLLAVAAWAMYLPSARYGFVYYDDVRILKDHPELYGQDSLAGDLRAIFVTYFPREEPLLIRDVSWALDSRVFGFGNPSGYHLGNIFLHGLVVALLFAFLLVTTRRYYFALATATAYLLLAIHTEPVCWIMGRKDILSTLFMLLALCAQTCRLGSMNRMIQSAWFVATLVCFLVALLSKISVLSFPMVLFLHAIFFAYLREELPADAPFFRGRFLLRECLVLLPGLAVSGFVFTWYQRTLTQMGVFDRGYAEHGLKHLWNLFVIDPSVFWLYLKNTFFPWNLRVLPSWPSLMTTYPVWQILVAGFTILGIFTIGFWLFRRHKHLCFFYGAFFVLMVPYINLIYVGIWLADRYVYFASFCLLALAVSGVTAALRKPYPILRPLVLTFAVLFACLNGFQKLRYQTCWRNAETLWQYHLALPHPSPIAFENLAAYYYAIAGTQLQDPAAMAVSMKKMAIVVDAGLNEFWPDPSRSPPPATYYLLFLKAIVQEVNGNLESALTSLLTSDRLRPGFDATNLNLARLYRKLAGQAADQAVKRSYVCAARDRFGLYLSHAFRGRLAPPEIELERSTMELECQAYSQPSEPKPARTKPNP